MCILDDRKAGIYRINKYKCPNYSFVGRKCQTAVLGWPTDNRHCCRPAVTMTDNVMRYRCLSEPVTITLKTYLTLPPNRLIKLPLGIDSCTLVHSIWQDKTASFPHDMVVVFGVVAPLVSSTKFKLCSQPARHVLFLISSKYHVNVLFLIF